MEDVLPLFEYTEITPDTARELLSFNTHNRPVRGRVVAAYAADIRGGKWQANGESIKFAADGTLLDGQHRLYAVIEAETPVKMLVVRGLENDTQDTVDGGVKRKFADVLILRGEKQASTLAAIVRRIVIWEAGGVAGRSNLAPTNAMMLQALEKYPYLREVASQANGYQAKCGLPGSITGMCMWLFGRLPDAEEDIRFFFDRLADFQALTKGDPIYELRKTLESTRNVRGTRSEVFLTAITIKAWNAFRRGDSVGVLKFISGGAHPEKFPEPV